MKSPAPFVSVVLVNPTGEVLLARRTDRADGAEVWSLPARPLEGGETWLSSANKTLREVAGFEGVALKLSGIYSDVVAVPEASHLLVANFVVRPFQKEVPPTHGLFGMKWFSPNDFPSTLSQGEVLRVNDALKFEAEVFVR